MLKKLIEHNSGYYSAISNLECRDWGRMLYNPEIPLHIDSNHAEGIQAKLRTLPRVLAEVEEFYRRHGLTPRVRINQFDRPKGIETALAQRGYIIHPASYRIMLWDNIPLQPTVRPGLTVERVGLHNRAEAVHIISGERSWGKPETIVAIFGREFANPGVVYYLVRNHGTPAATGLIFYIGEYAKIENVRTLREHRGLGCATALIQHIQGEFTAWGGKGLYLLAGDAVMGLYHKQGFESLGEVQEVNAFLP